MDPEDLREVISAYQKCVAETVQRFGGFVAKYMGDGVLIYFGYPQAHEDDAERAVRAGLELIAAVSALKAPVSLQTRVGIATGLVVVGDLIGSGEAQERGIVGETPNSAARLQGIAEPNTVLIAESTRKLLGNLFDLQDLGGRDLSAVPSLTIPTSLHASLLARLDRLAPTREVAQIAATLGRSFSHELISAVAQMPQQRVDDALGQLVNAELIFRRGTPPDAEYTFKHALVQDAAYSKGVGSLVRAWAVVRPVSVESRFEAMHATGLTELVGRETRRSSFCCDGGHRRKLATAVWF